MDLSIVIPTKDRNKILKSSLVYLQQATSHLACEIIIVNDSKTSIPDVSGLNNILVVNNPKSGVASARNLGASLSEANIILFMDDDIQVSKQVIDHTLEFYKNHTHVCLNPDWRYPDTLTEKLRQKVFGRFMIAHNLVSYKGWYNSETWREHELFPSLLISSFFLPVTREQFLKSGGYNENFPHAGFEDYDFPMRLRKQGANFFIDTRICVLHNEEDRSDLNNWLNRQLRGAQTRRMGVSLGYPELAIQYTWWKKLILRSARPFKPMLIGLVKNFPDLQTFDFLLFRIILLLQATSIFEGYHKKQA